MGFFFSRKKTSCAQEDKMDKSVLLKRNSKSPSDEPKIAVVTPWNRFKSGFPRRPREESGKATKKLTRTQLLRDREMYSMFLYEASLENLHLKKENQFLNSGAADKIIHQEREITQLQAVNESLLRDHEYKDEQIKGLEQQNSHWRGEHKFLVRELLRTKLENKSMEKEKADMMQEMERLRLTCTQQAESFMNQLNESRAVKKRWKPFVVKKQDDKIESEGLTSLQTRSRR
jgi:hypothetical protein